MTKVRKKAMVGMFFFQGGPIIQSLKKEVLLLKEGGSGRVGGFGSSETKMTNPRGNCSQPLQTDGLYSARELLDGDPNERENKRKFMPSPVRSSLFLKDTTIICHSLTHSCFLPFVFLRVPNEADFLFGDMHW